MTNDNIRIKRKRHYILYGLLSLVILIAGVLLIAMPFLQENLANPTLFYVIGVLLVVLGLACYALVLVQEILFPDALVLTNKGFYNHLIGGREGVYVDWTDITSIKIFGLSKSPSLGLTLEDTENYLQMLNGRQLARATENIAMELPVIEIPQRCVELPISELKALFSRMVKGALSWETYSTQGKKAETVKAEDVPSAQETPTPAAEVVQTAPEQAKAAEQPVEADPDVPSEPDRQSSGPDDVILLDLGDD